MRSSFRAARACGPSAGTTGPLVEELLRYDIPARHGLPRVATRDVDLPSGPVRAGEAVLPILREANRDPDAYDEPDRFDPHRDGPAHLAFGHGAHSASARTSPGWRSRWR